MGTEKLQSRPTTVKKKKRTNLAIVRKQRIREHRAASLKQQDSLLANVGAEAANLMSLGQHIHEAIEERLANSEEPLEEFKKLTPALDQYLKITRQWERLAQFGYRAAAGLKNQDPLKNVQTNCATTHG